MIQPVKRSHVINNQLEITVFPDTYWIETYSGYLLCQSRHVDEAIQILGAIVKTASGYSYVPLTKANLFIFSDGVRLDGKCWVFTIKPDVPRLYHNRYITIAKKIHLNHLDKVKGYLVDEVSAYINLPSTIQQVVIRAPSPTERRFGPFEVLKAPSAPPEAEESDVEGEWSLL